MEQNKPVDSGTSAPARETFQKDARVRKRFEYRMLQNEGRRLSTRHFTVLMHTGVKEAGRAPRLGMTVTKKVGSAPERNRVKRLLREVFRRNQKIFREGYAYLFIAKTGAPLLTYESLLAEVQSIGHALGAATGQGPRSANRPRR